MNQSGDIFRELLNKVSDSSNKAYENAEVIKKQCQSDVERICALRAEFWRMEESLEKILDIASSQNPCNSNLIIHNTMVGLGLKDDSKE